MLSIDMSPLLTGRFTHSCKIALLSLLPEGKLSINAELVLHQYTTLILTPGTEVNKRGTCVTSNNYSYTVYLLLEGKLSIHAELVWLPDLAYSQLLRARVWYSPITLSFFCKKGWWKRWTNEKGGQKLLIFNFCSASIRWACAYLH